MIRQCCRCGNVFGEKEPLEDKSITGGTCDECFPIEIKKNRDAHDRYKEAMGQKNFLEAMILKILEGHQGRENVVGRFDLVDRVNQNTPLFPYSERRIRRTIKHLIEQHGEWIGSCSKGYFMIESSEEFEKVFNYYEGYAMSMLHVMAKLKKSSLAALLGQLSIKFGG